MKSGPPARRRDGRFRAWAGGARGWNQVPPMALVPAGRRATGAAWAAWPPTHAKDDGSVASSTSHNWQRSQCPSFSCAWASSWLAPGASPRWVNACRRLPMGASNRQADSQTSTAQRTNSGEGAWRRPGSDGMRAREGKGQKNGQKWNDILFLYHWRRWRRAGLPEYDASSTARSGIIGRQESGVKLNDECSPPFVVDEPA